MIVQEPLDILIKRNKISALTQPLLYVARRIQERTPEWIRSARDVQEAFKLRQVANHRARWLLERRQFPRLGPPFGVLRTRRAFRARERSRIQFALRRNLVG